MRLSGTIKTLLLLVFAITMLSGLQGCSGDSNTISGPDFSTVPPPYSIAEAESTITREDGLIIHIIEKGAEVLPPVNQRDQISLYYTGRTYDGTVFASSYASGRTTPAVFTNLTPVAQGNSSSLIEGFREGLLGMYEGEKRKIIIPPSLGYGDAQRGTNGFDLRNDTLVYDVKLARIGG